MKNKAFNDKAADSTAHAVHGVVAGTDIEHLRWIRQSAPKRN